MWIGRETYEPGKWKDALATARAEVTTPIEDRLLDMPLPSDCLETGLERLGIDVSSAGEGFL